MPAQTEADPVLAAQELLRSTDAATLLRKTHQLTHRLHSLNMREGGTPKDPAERESRAADVRAQRDLIDAELLRRCGEQR